MTDLPATWANAKFSDFGTWIGGGTPSKANPRFWNGPIPWVSPKDMKTKVIRKAIDGITEEAVENSAAKLVTAGSVLIVTRSGILTHTLPIAVTAVESTLNQDLKALAVPDGISSDYIAWGMRAFEQRILDKCRKGGTTVHSIEMPRLASFELPIAPTNEQRRIVEKIEAMFDEIDKGVESLQTARTTLGLYRQSLLKSAFEGRLTADWRAQNADKLEAPEPLLARIQRERDARHKTSLDAWQDALAQWRADGEKGKKPAKPKRLTVLEVTVAPFPIPENWVALSVGSLGRVETGATPPTKSKDNFGGDIPFFKPTDLDAGVDVREAREFLSLVGAEKSRPFSAGTILVTCIGATIGKTGLAGVDAACNQQINYIEPDPNFEPRFIYYQIISPFFQDQIKANASSTTLPILNKGKFSQLPTIICSPAEQTEIVRILDARLEAADALEAEIDAALTRANALRQSILKKAFSGQLVPQDPHDEPASVLLERIKADRAMNPRTKKRTTTHA